jgi:hypothetical protein
MGFGTPTNRANCRSCVFIQVAQWFTAEAESPVQRGSSPQDFGLVAGAHHQAARAALRSYSTIMRARAMILPARFSWPAGTLANKGLTMPVISNVLAVHAGVVDDELRVGQRVGR